METHIKELQLKIIDFIPENNKPPFQILESPELIIHQLKDFLRVCKFMSSDASFSNVFHDKLKNIKRFLKESKHFLRFFAEMQVELIDLYEIEAINKEFESIYSKIFAEHQKHVKKISNVYINILIFYKKFINLERNSISFVLI